MPRAPSSNLEQVTNSVRFSIIEHQWLMRYIEEHPELGNLNQVLRIFVSDVRNWYGLPEALRTRLEADAKAGGKDLRTYVTDLLTRRYEELLRAEMTQGASAGGRGRK